MTSQKNIRPFHIWILTGLFVAFSANAHADDSVRISQQISVSVPDSGALLENSDRHYIFNAKLDELPHFIARTRELAPGKKIRVIVIYSIIPKIHIFIARSRPYIKYLIYPSRKLRCRLSVFMREYSAYIRMPKSINVIVL